MAQLEKMQYSPEAQTTGGWDGASRSDDCHLHVKVSTLGTPGNRHQPRNEPFTYGQARSSTKENDHVRSIFSAYSAQRSCHLSSRGRLRPCPARGSQPRPGRSGTEAKASIKDNAVRPFHINIPEDALADLRRRVLATRWPDKETVTDQSQGVQLAKLQERTLLGHGL